jgi:putative nucleotidyltransferase with HDIG domain
MAGNLLVSADWWRFEKSMQNLYESQETWNQALNAYLETIKHLPPTPTLMIQLIELFRQPYADADEIVTVLRRDPALSVEVLRRCNSSHYGLEAPVMDINEAVFRIGFYEVYQITVSLSGMKALTPKQAVPGFPVRELQRHSSITAIAASALALEVGESEGIAFTAGLLHDVGKLVLALGERERYIAVLEECVRTNTSLSETEKLIFGFNHDEVGARLLHRWGVPIEVVKPALGHNDPVQPGEAQVYVAITNLASHLANRLDQKAVSGPFWNIPGVKATMQFLNLNEKQVLGWEAVVRNKARELSPLLGA